MRAWSLLFLLLVGVTRVAATPRVGTETWRVEPLPDFQVYYPASQQRYVAPLVELLQEEYARVTHQLGVTFRRPARVYLAPNQETFQRLTGGLVPDWGAGVADLSRGVVVLQMPGSAGEIPRFRKTVRHEFIHLLVGQAIQPVGLVPTWFHEGLAVSLSYDEEFSGGEAISKALLSNSIVTLDEIDHVLQFQREKARLAYEQSYSAVRYLEQRFGQDALTTFLKALSHATSFERTFEEVFGLSLADFELDWYRHIEKNYRWRFLLDFETFLWIFMLAVFIFVFVAIKWRNRRTLKRWEEEERRAF